MNIQKILIHHINHLYLGDTMIYICNKCKKRTFSYLNNDDYVCITGDIYLCKKCFILWDRYYEKICTPKNYITIYNDWLNKTKGFVFR